MLQHITSQTFLITHALFPTIRRRRSPAVQLFTGLTLPATHMYPSPAKRSNNITPRTRRRTETKPRVAHSLKTSLLVSIWGILLYIPPSWLQIITHLHKNTS